MAFTVPDVCRYTVLGHWSNGHKWANVLDFQIDTTGSTLNRAEFCAATGDDIIQNFQSQILPNLTNNVVVEGIRVMDLDSEDGVTALLPPHVGEPTVGGLSGASTTPNVSFLVHKVILGTRTTRAGRFYLPGVQEASVDEDGGLSGTGVTDLAADLVTFFENTDNDGSGPFGGAAHMVVSHLGPRPTPPAEDNRVGTYSRVQGLTLDLIVATQRRRLR